MARRRVGQDLVSPQAVALDLGVNVRPEILDTNTYDWDMVLLSLADDKDPVPTYLPS